jgi:seryl-tRNA synthetase
MNDTESRKAFLDQLIAAGLFIPTGIAGFYGRGGAFEDVIHRFSRLVDEISDGDGAERMYFPPLIPKSTLERTGYMESMPQLVGVIHAFSGSERDQRQMLGQIKEGDDWSEFMAGTDLALAPAACYPLYPTCQGQLGSEGRLVDLSASYVFRREPSDDPARLQMFRQREMVRIGTPEMVTAWRGLWMERGLELLRSLGLPVAIDEASDPFFGRGGRMMAATQREQKLKFEILVPICSEENPTAVTSFNYHREHFGSTFGIRTAQDETAHTACLGFGVERIALSLFKTHGLDRHAWPSEVRERLWP